MGSPITAAKGQINVCLETLNNQGMQQCLLNAAAAATLSLTTQPVTSAVQGARLVVWVMFAPQAGTMQLISTSRAPIRFGDYFHNLAEKLRMPVL